MPDVREWPEHSDTGKDNRKHHSSWIPVKERRGGTRSLSFVPTTEALHCTEINHTEWVLSVYIAGRRTEDTFCRRPGRVPSGRKTARTGRSNGLRHSAGDAERSKMVTCRGAN